MKQGIDVSKYLKKKATKTALTSRHAIPVSPDMKARIDAVSETVKINEALRDCLEELLSAAEKNQRVA